MLTYLIKIFHEFFDSNFYGAALEDYIINNHPRTIADIETLQKEFDNKITRNLL